MILTTTTLRNIKENNPCQTGWQLLIKNLNKTEEDDEPLHFKTILDSNGIYDAIWCLRSVVEYDYEIGLFTLWCARQCEYLDATGFCENINNIAEMHLNGQCSSDTMGAARNDVTVAWFAERDKLNLAMRSVSRFRSLNSRKSMISAGLASIEAALRHAKYNVLGLQKLLYHLIKQKHGHLQELRHGRFLMQREHQNGS